MKAACDLNEPCYYSMSSVRKLSIISLCKAIERVRLRGDAKFLICYQGSTGKPKYVLIGSALLTNSYALMRDGCDIKSTEVRINQTKE